MTPTHEKKIDGYLQKIETWTACIEQGNELGIFDVFEISRRGMSGCRQCQIRSD